MPPKKEEELEPTLIAEHLGKLLKQIEPHTKPIAAGFVVVVAALVGYGLYTSGQAAKRSDATLQLLMDNPEVSSQYPGTVAAAWSLLSQGNENLALGVNALYNDRDEAETLLNQSIDFFKDARAASNETIILSRANLGVGMAAESLGEVDEALEAYGRCVDANESKQMVEVAQSRIEALSLPSNQEFLAWFGEQDFAPADPSMPPELPGASALPDLPDLNLPDLSLGDQLGLGGEESTDSESDSGGAGDGPEMALPPEDGDAATTEETPGSPEVESTTETENNENGEAGGEATDSSAE